MHKVEMVGTEEMSNLLKRRVKRIAISTAFTSDLRSFALANVEQA
jgi:hypothetical protein